MKAKMESKRVARAEDGVVLVAVVALLIIIAGMCAVLIPAATSTTEVVLVRRDTISSEYLAEGGMEHAEKEVLSAIANHRPVRLDEWIETEICGHRVYYMAEETGLARTHTDPYGVITFIQPYVLSVAAKSGDVVTVLQRTIDAGQTPIFQYAVFYHADLEMLPGPSMTLSGRVHANGDIYIGTGDSSTLTIDNTYLRTAGNLYRRRMDDGGNTGGTVQVRVNGSETFEDIESWWDLDGRGVPSTSGFDSDFDGYDGNGDGDMDDPEPGDMRDWTARALDKWNGSVLTGDHGVEEVSPPSIGSIKRFDECEDGNYEWDAELQDYVEVAPGTGTHEKGYFHGQADLIIIDDKVYNAAGEDITADLPEGTITQQTFFDGREETDVTVTQIDISLLNTSEHFPENRLIYAARKDASVQQPNGVRLANGSEVANPLTVVSEDPIYIWGDYNSIDKKGCSVMTDALNLLSNAWDDTKGDGELPDSSETTYNCAFITGAYATSPGQYNGGFENLPRFHENWSNINANIRGSFVDTWDSEIAMGLWEYGGDNYTAPIRNWDYDTNFNNPDNLPPFTPMVVGIQRVVWWEHTDEIPDLEF